MKYNELENHLKSECLYVFNNCDMCQHVYLNHERHSHLCPEQGINCPHCYQSIKRKDMDSHLLICEEMPILCIKCLLEFKRKD